MNFENLLIGASLTNFRENKEENAPAEESMKMLNFFHHNFVQNMI